MSHHQHLATLAEKSEGSGQVFLKNNHVYLESADFVRFHLSFYTCRTGCSEDEKYATRTSIHLCPQNKTVHLLITLGCFGETIYNIRITSTSTIIPSPSIQGIFVSQIGLDFQHVKWSRGGFPDGIGY